MSRLKLTSIFVLATSRSNCKSSISRLKLKSTFVWQLWDRIAKVPFQGSNWNQHLFDNFEIKLQKFHFKAQTEIKICLATLRSNCKSSISRLKLKSTFVCNFEIKLQKFHLKVSFMDCQQLNGNFCLQQHYDMYMWNFNKYCMISFSLGWLPTVPSLIRH
jgi:hypothetical protein